VENPHRPVYTIGIVSELISVHPETIRVWERNGVIHPGRRSGRRFYSESDLARLRFVQRLTGEGLNLPAIRHYLKLYPCWHMDGCPHCMHRSEDASCTKPCWKEEVLAISEMGHFLNRTLWHNQAALTSSLRPWL